MSVTFDKAISKIIQDNSDTIKTITKNTAIGFAIIEKTWCNIKGDTAGEEAIKRLIKVLEDNL